MGLIARELEARGVPTLSMSSALSITASVRPPRAVHLDFPLGHTAGRPNDPGLNLEIMRATLAAFASIEVPGAIVELPFEWDADDAWKDEPERSAPDADRASTDGPTQGDDRRARDSTPQYQCDEDRRAAESALAAGPCTSCVYVE